ncbi:MAG: hypothetical protein ACE5GO_12415 [Anaerolineales bacterium]
MRFAKTLLPLLILAILIPARAVAQTCSQVTWGETRTRSFAFIYPDNLPLGEEIAAALGERLDSEFVRFVNLFQASLPLPISIRIYDDERDYYCFNTLAPAIPVGQTHSHVGSREIALIAQNITDDHESWRIEGLNTLRYELAILFVKYVANDKAPPGLEIGTGIYAEDPALSFEHRFEAAPPPTGEPTATWRGLWEAPDVIQSPEHALQNASIVSYLVDVYGWDDFLSFLESLRTSESYRQALTEAYNVDAGALEDHWLTYYPLYFRGRWRTNHIYALSLAPYEQLIAAGAYQAAADGLAEVIELLVHLEEFELLSQAQALNQKTLTGLEADALARQSRQAYLEGDYPTAVDFAVQAKDKYAEIGDARNLEALDAYRSQAQEVIDLHAELAEIQAGIKGTGGAHHTGRLTEIGLRLGELGDQEGHDQATQTLKTLEASNQSQAVRVGLIGAATGLILLGHRVYLFRRQPPPEAMLQ